MFALEIHFKDGISQPEMILVRRPQALVGSSDLAHVVVEDMANLQYQLRLVRDLGRRFRCKPVGMRPETQVPAMLEGMYDGSTTIDLGPVSFHVSALDFDLGLRETEPPDRAGVRVLRQACATPSPLFPALVLPGTPPLVVSFVPDQPIYIGRSKECALRLDSSEISAKHARIGYESGQFWVEDLGSTNGTFVNQQQIAGRVAVAAGVPILLGREVTIIGATSEDQIGKVTRQGGDRVVAIAPERRYPILLSVSEVARPARMVIPIGTTVTIGRDPKSDMWLGAPHISRSHCAMTLSKTGLLSVNDQSTNGTAYDEGILKRGDVLESSKDGKVLDFGGGVTVAICFSEEHERQFMEAHGSPKTFVRNEQASPGEQRDIARGPAVLNRTPRPRSGTVRENARSVQFRKLYEVYSEFSPAKKAVALLWCVAFIVMVVIVLNLILGLVT